MIILNLKLSCRELRNLLSSRKKKRVIWFHLYFSRTEFIEDLARIHLILLSVQNAGRSGWFRCRGILRRRPGSAERGDAGAETGARGHGRHASPMQEEQSQASELHRSHPGDFTAGCPEPCSGQAAPPDTQPWASLARGRTVCELQDTATSFSAT